ncbi:MAG: hypothetical protein RSB86_16780 [Comamonas sp.]|uniref:hypothetical protein n=1 Tax=Comamonas sp. TaxID=34028 RepID=UPI002FCC42AF
MHHLYALRAYDPRSRMLKRLLQRGQQPYPNLDAAHAYSDAVLQTLHITYVRMHKVWMYLCAMVD